MSQKLPINDFKWVKQEELSNFNEDFIKNYDENGNIGYFFEGDIDYPKELFNLHQDLPFLPESRKVNNVEKLICSKKVHRIIHFKQKAWLKVYIDMNTELRKNSKN